MRTWSPPIPADDSHPGDANVTLPRSQCVESIESSRGLPASQEQANFGSVPPTILRPQRDLVSKTARFFR